MLKNYFKIAFRNLWKKKGFSFINIIGLAVGMASCFFIFVYVHFELSYDRFHSKADRIYRIVGDLKSSSETLHRYETPAPLAQAIKREFPEVQQTTRFIPASLLVKKDNIKFQEQHSLWADPSIFLVFDFPLKYGDPNTALKEPNSVVFSETAAHKYFGNINPLGQSILLTGLKIHATVTGVMKDIPENSHIKADMLVSMSTFVQSFAQNIESDWGSFAYSTYLLMSQNANIAGLQSKFPAFLEKYSSETLKTNSAYTIALEPLGNIYLHSSYGGLITGNLNNVKIFIIIGVFLLLIACVNFINLTTARSLERAKEVGLRKCSGARYYQLIFQYLIESSIVSLISFFLAVIFCLILIPFFNQLSGKIVSQGIFEHIQYILYLFIVALGIGLLAGIYPAFVLSSFTPISVLKGRFVSGNKGTLLRKILVITQFTISTALIIATLTVYSQLDFMRNRPLGFDKGNGNILVLAHNGDIGIFNFKEEIANIPSVKSASISSAIPGHDYSDDGNDVSMARIMNDKNELQQINLNFYNVDTNFTSLYGIKVIAGRNFSNEVLRDSSKVVILNKMAVERLGYTSPENIIGKRFIQENFIGTIIGVVDDFHFHSLKEAIQPLCLQCGRDYWQYISLKINGGNLKETITALQADWNKTIPDRPFDYFFLDESFNNQYRSEERFGKLFLDFCVLSMLISSLGLWGLASYSTIQKKREIGIRKVLGASTFGIVLLLYKDFLFLIILSFLIASPLSFLVMNKWLIEFPYRTSISWTIFLTAGTAAITIALMTISFQSIKAAIMNPAKNLRN